MEREIYSDLLRWKSRDDRMPLILEGVRQCGKTYILRKFGEENYRNVVYINFEDVPDLCDIFQQDLDPSRIVTRLSMTTGKKIEPESTLIIFDEIQFCNRALTSLKYFCERAPEYHVACAGSLLGVLLSKPYSFPVGKVDRLNMGPMSFREFLLANSEEILVKHMDGNDPTEKLPMPVIAKLETYLNYYFVIGGMPAAVRSWVRDKDIEKVDRILGDIVRDYEKDFSKHASESIAKLTLIWDSIPTQLARENKKFMFSHVRSGARAKDLEDALEWLIDAGLVHKTKRVDPPKVPLSIYADNASFKIYMADLGILRKMARLRPDFMFSKDKDMDLFRGMAAENYVHNEVLRSAEGPLYYWRSDGKAEVDIIAQIEGVAVPIEVKAGNSPSKSLSEYIRKYSPPIAVKASMATGGNGVVCNIPIYAIWKVRDHIHRSMRSGTDTQ